jgi:hypothetical protein
MVKVPAVIIFAPIAYLGWEARRWSVVRDWRLVAGMSVALLLTIAWYVHADTLFHQTGLGEAIWHPSGAYSPDIMEVAGPTLTVSHWATLAQLTDPEFYNTLLQRFWHLHFTPIVTIVVLLGALTQWRVPHWLMIDAWFATVVLFILVSAEGNRWHEFHQLPILLPSALYFGLAAWPLFDARWLRRPAPLAVSAAVAAAALASIGIVGVRSSRVVPEYFRPGRLSMDPIALGHRIEESTPPGSLVITVEYPRYGGNSPILLYHARRKGWSFDVEGITPAVIERLRDQYGAAYFATTIWWEMAEKKPDVAAFLEQQTTRRIDAPGGMAIFALR